MSERQPWAFVAHKGARFGGVISPELPKRDVRKFIADFVLDGYTITPVYDRPEYLSLLDGLKK